MVESGTFYAATPLLYRKRWEMNVSRSLALTPRSYSIAISWRDWRMGVSDGGQLENQSHNSASAPRSILLQLLSHPASRRASHLAELGLPPCSCDPVASRDLRPLG
jgi:hypothetical protein